MKSFKADLHIHSCLSPCGDLDMSPRRIVKRSLEKGLDLICLCDHNSAGNVGATMRAAASGNIHVLAGLEVSSIEEVHSLALFDTEKQAVEFEKIICRYLKGTNRPEIFGDQVIANEFDEVEGFNDRLLIGSVQMKLNEVVEAVHSLGGISIASHVDRPSFSIMSQLGFLPDHIDLDALEISRNKSLKEVRSMIPGMERFPVVSFSDAHFLEDIGTGYTLFSLERPTISEIKMALLGVEGRRVTLA